VKKRQFEVGNQVRVLDGDTVYVITRLLPDGYKCFIREHGTAPNGKLYAEQPFDISLLQHRS
jgi:hypothetical protein